MKKGIIFRLFRVLIVVVAAVAVAVFLLKMKPKAKRQERTETRPLVEVISVSYEKRNMMIEGYGTVRPTDPRKLVAEIRGRVLMTAPNLKEGGYIKKGELLISIDPRPYQFEVERQKIQVKKIDTELKRLNQEALNLKKSIKIAGSAEKLARAEFTRLKKLAKNNVAAQTSLDQAEQKHLSSLDRLQGLQNQLALTGPKRERLWAERSMYQVMLSQAGLELEKTTIAAPFNGWVLEKRIEAGEYVNVGQLLGSIYSEGALEIEVKVPLKELKWFPSDMVSDNMPYAEISMNSGGSKNHWKGRVVRIKAQMDEKTRTLPIIVEVKDVKSWAERGNTFTLRPGMFVTVKIRGIETGQVFILPRHVVHDGDTVYVVNKDQLNIRHVHVLRRHKESVFIDSGLSNGELIIKSPLAYASEGMYIRVK